VDRLAGRLAEGLADLERRDLKRVRRVVDSPQGPHVRVAGRALVNFSSNDYLGLANHPRLREAAHRAIDAHGVALAAIKALYERSQALDARIERLERDNRELRAAGRRSGAGDADPRCAHQGQMSP